MTTAPNYSGSTTQVQCFKTRMCHFFQQKRCTRGNLCLFAHSGDEVRLPPDLSKTKICVRWKKGACRRGALCSYAHGMNELRLMKSSSTESQDRKGADGGDERRSHRSVRFSFELKSSDSRRDLEATENAGRTEVNTSDDHHPDSAPCEYATDDNCEASPSVKEEPFGEDLRTSSQAAPVARDKRYLVALTGAASGARSPSAFRGFVRDASCDALANRHSSSHFERQPDTASNSHPESASTCAPGLSKTEIDSTDRSENFCTNNYSSSSSARPRIAAPAEELRWRVGGPGRRVYHGRTAAGIDAPSFSEVCRGVGKEDFQSVELSVSNADIASRQMLTHSVRPSWRSLPKMYGVGQHQPSENASASDESLSQSSLHKSSSARSADAVEESIEFLSPRICATTNANPASFLTREAGPMELRQPECWTCPRQDSAANSEHSMRYRSANPLRTRSSWPVLPPTEPPPPPSDLYMQPPAHTSHPASRQFAEGPNNFPHRSNSENEHLPPGIEREVKSSHFGVGTFCTPGTDIPPLPPSTDIPGPPPGLQSSYTPSPSDEYFLAPHRSPDTSCDPTLAQQPPTLGRTHRPGRKHSPPLYPTLPCVPERDDGDDDDSDDDSGGNRQGDSVAFRQPINNEVERTRFDYGCGLIKEELPRLGQVPRRSESDHQRDDNDLKDQWKNSPSDLAVWIKPSQQSSCRSVGWVSKVGSGGSSFNCSEELEKVMGSLLEKMHPGEIRRMAAKNDAAKRLDMPQSIHHKDACDTARTMTPVASHNTTSLSSGKSWQEQTGLTLTSSPNEENTIFEKCATLSPSSAPSPQAIVGDPRRPCTGLSPALGSHVPGDAPFSTSMPSEANAAPAPQRGPPADEEECPVEPSDYVASHPASMSSADDSSSPPHVISPGYRSPERCHDCSGLCQIDNPPFDSNSEASSGALEIGLQSRSRCHSESLLDVKFDSSTNAGASVGESTLRMSPFPSRIFRSTSYDDTICPSNETATNNITWRNTLLQKESRLPAVPVPPKANRVADVCDILPSNNLMEGGCDDASGVCDPKLETGAFQSPLCSRSLSSSTVASFHIYSPGSVSLPFSPTLPVALCVVNPPALDTGSLGYTEVGSPEPSVTPKSLTTCAMPIHPLSTFTRTAIDVRASLATKLAGGITQVGRHPFERTISSADAKPAPQVERPCGPRIQRLAVAPDSSYHHQSCAANGTVSSLTNDINHHHSNDMETVSSNSFSTQSSNPCGSLVCDVSGVGSPIDSGVGAAPCEVSELGVVRPTGHCSSQQQQTSFTTGGSYGPVVHSSPPVRQWPLYPAGNLGTVPSSVPPNNPHPQLHAPMNGSSSFSAMGQIPADTIFHNPVMGGGFSPETAAELSSCAGGLVIVPTPQQLQTYPLSLQTPQTTTEATSLVPLFTAPPAQGPVAGYDWHCSVAGAPPGAVLQQLSAGVVSPANWVLHPPPGPWAAAPYVQYLDLVPYHVVGGVFGYPTRVSGGYDD